MEAEVLQRLTSVLSERPIDFQENKLAKSSASQSVGQVVAGFALSGLMALGLTPALAQEAKVLNIYNWSDYIAADTIQNFEKETGIKVRYDTFDNNEIVHAKLVAGKTGYDIVVPSSNWARLQMDGGLLRKLDKSQLPNLKNLDPDIQQQIASLDPGNQYLVDWLWGYVAVGINTAKVKAALGDMPLPDNAWDLIFDPKYASKLKSCGISVLDSASEVMPIAMIYAGKADGRIDAKEQQAIVERIGNTNEATIQFLRKEFAAATSVRDFAWSVPIGMESAVYAASLSTIDVDTQEEVDYLRELAHGLRLQPKLCNQIHQQYGVKPIF